ncbi:hypothetical protein [Streptomyces sp. NPDC047928]|uniref:hypothetical protein n=1 Tax=unclassified Streptomyces TaxID=2593676 RepID=UPI003719734B
MRLRTTLAAAVGAFALVLTLPTSAGAATGEFSYTYYTENGDPETGRLTDPDSGRCITLPEVESYAFPPAHTPKNRTTSTATVFTDVDCEGLFYVLRPGGSASERLKLRSVVFS